MNFDALVLTVLQASIFLFVLGFALEVSLGDAFFLWQQPAKLIRSLLAMNMVMPLVAICFFLFPLDPAVKMALLALSLSPVPPFLPKRQLQSGGSKPYAISLFTATAVFSIVVVPLATVLLEAVFGMHAYVPPGKVAAIIAITVLAPFAIAVTLRALMPAVANWLSNPVSLLAAVALISCLVALFVAFWPTTAALVGNGTILAIVGFCLIGLMTGHFLGGTQIEDRIVLAYSTASRHPGVALAITAVSGVGQGRAAAATLLYLLVNFLISIPYSLWCNRHRGTPSGESMSRVRRLRADCR